MDAQQLSPGKLKILQAVATLLEDASQKITINRIAGKVSVTEAAIYRHYRSKDDIFTAIFDYMQSHFLTPLNYVQKETQSTESRLHFVFKQYIEFFQGHPGLARLMLGQGSNESPGIAERVQMLNAKIRGQIALILKWGETNKHLRMGAEPATELFYGIIVAAAMAEVCSLPQLAVEERWDAYKLAVFKE